MTPVSPDHPSAFLSPAAREPDAPGAPRQAARLPGGDAVLAGLVPRRRREGRIDDAMRVQCARNRPLPGSVLPLAGYLLDRQLNGSLVDVNDTERLRLADQARLAAQAALPFGRGNVRSHEGEDICESQVRALAAQLMHWEFQRSGFQFGADPVVSFQAQGAMAAKVYGAGVCDNYASIAALAYGASAEGHGGRPGESVRVVAHTTERHTWAEVHAPQARSPTIVMDAWAPVPAVFAEDSRYARDRGKVQINASIDLPDAALAHEWTEDFSRGLKANGMYDCREEAEARCREKAPEPSRIPMQVLDADFAGRVHERLQTRDPWQAVQTEVRALGVAKSLGRCGVPVLLAEVPRITRYAKALVAPGKPTGVVLTAPVSYRPSAASTS